ncbi:MAG: clan AA aspartic protease [Flavobacteriales bacterium]|nr:MAG: clan AA aspartic protease [Flavobacteriales bacterium]
MKTTIPLTIFPIENDGYHIKVTVKINGKEANLILDTGASRTVFDETRITNFVNDPIIEEQDRMSSGLGTNTMESKKVVIRKLQIGDIEIVNYDATILDLMHVNQSYEKLELAPVDGVLGGDILNDYQAIIDYTKKELVLKDLDFK